jgi:hypothetical protein
MADYDITVTVPNQGPPGPQGPPGITDASLLDSGTLADARLSTNVPLKDAANTFTANQTLDGTNNVAPNQTAASSSSLLTRSLGDARYRSLAPTVFGFVFDDESYDAVTLTEGDYTLIAFNEVAFGSGLTDSAYVVPSSGYYLLKASILIESPASGNVGLFCFVNGVRTSDFAWTQIAAGQINLDGVSLIELSAEDEVSVYAYSTVAGIVFYPTVGGALKTSFFEGFKL